MSSVLYLPDLTTGRMELLVSKAYAHGSERLKWGFSQLQGKKEFVKICGIERKVGSARGISWNLLITLESEFLGTEPGNTSLQGPWSNFKGQNWGGNK